VGDADGGGWERVKSADWLAERFGLSGPVTLDGPVDRGFQGQVWRLTCGSRAYAVKEALVPLDHDQVVAAYELQQRAEAAGVMAPRQLLTVTGDPAVYADGETLRLFDWLELAPPDRDLDAIELGRLLAALHTAGGPTTEEVDPWFVEPVGRDHWVELVAELRLAGAPFAATLGDLVDELTASEAVLEAPRDVRVCHRDLWADNLRAEADGHPVVIDWDNCGPAPSAGELAMVLVEFGSTPARARDLYTAYVDAGGPARITGRGDFTMPIAVLHHIVETGARQWLAASGDVARHRAAGRVTEFTDVPFLLADVERLLAALAR
jgi:Ser/Thr protein kinase RdoA (MazF antagonist)